MNVDTRTIGGGTIRLTRNAHGSVTALDIASGWAVSIPPALFNQSSRPPLLVQSATPLLGPALAPVPRQQPPSAMTAAPSSKSLPLYPISAFYSPFTR